MNVLRQRWVFVLAAGLVASAAAMYTLVRGGTFSPSKPRYGGNPLSYWVAQATTEHSYLADLFVSVRQNNLERRQQAFAALSKLGEPAVPALTEMLSHPDDSIRYSAASALGEIGPAAKSAVGALAKRLQTGHILTRQHAADALGKIGADAEVAVPELRDALQDRDAFIRLKAALALSQKLVP